MRRSTSRRALLAGAATATAALAGCTGSGELTESRAIERTVAVDGASAFAVEVVAGDATVRAADRDDVLLEGTARAVDGDALDRVELTERRDGDRLVLERQYEDDSLWPFGSGPDAAIDLTVTVPADLRVERVETTSGDAAVGDATGPTTVRSTSGDVDATGVDGAVTAEATSGDATLEGTFAALDLTSGSASATVGGVADPATVELVSGNVELALSPDLDVRVVVETTSGDVSVDGEAYDRPESGEDRTVAVLGDGGQTLSVETVSGDVTLSTT